jgi:hypothetical protein
LAIMAAVWLLAATSCGRSVANAEQNLQTAGNMFAAFNRHDWQAMAGYYVENASFLDPSFGTGYVTKSRQQTIDKYAGLQKMFPGIKDSIVTIFAFDNKVTVEFVSSDAGFRLPICTILSFKDGFITTDATYYDNSK